MSADPLSNAPDGLLSSGDPAAVLVGRRLRLAIGVVSIGAGVFMLAWPSRTLLFLGVLIGVQLVLVGLMRVWATRAFELAPRLKLLGYALAALTVVAGIICVLRPGASLLLVAIFVGVGWIADGVIELVAFFTRSAGDRRYALLSGVLTLLGGIVVLAFPRTSLVALAQLTGVVLLVFGTAYLVSGIVRGRSAST